MFSLPSSFCLHEKENHFKLLCTLLTKLKNTYTLNGVDVKALNDLFANINLINYFLTF
jgi:hypothetical protein